jgi:serine protease AprX
MITSPGNDPYVITVGAMKDMGTVTRADDLMASYSSKGPTAIDNIVKPDIVAPGNHVIAAVPTGLALTNTYMSNKPLWSYYEINCNAGQSTDYFTLNGTSMATPMVSGTAALMLQKDPSLTPDVVKARLMKSATKNFPAVSTATDPVTGDTYTTYYDMFTVGAGYLDAWGALNETDTVGSGLSAVSPAVSVNSSTGQVTFVSGSHVVWGSNSVWDSHVVWGSTNLSGSNVVAGSHVVWGSATDSGFNVIWGTHVVWGSTTDDASESTNVAIYGDK